MLYNGGRMGNNARKMRKNERKMGMRQTLEFLSKCPNPLWKNPYFFISLPFEQNEDVNPTKATHPGMSPSDLTLAIDECAQLLSQNLIESTKSEWACQAFYVNKRSEQEQEFFSKFDLKAGFWQLGIRSEERYKTAFCIPNHHYQWTIMSFGLKVAPSIFQMVIVKIYEPLLPSALIYIDDILLFSSDTSSHEKLLQYFFDITKQFGVMLYRTSVYWKTRNGVSRHEFQRWCLWLPQSGTRILQKDASDKFWGAILLEEQDSKKRICAYASGKFSDAETRYHSTLKKVLAVKYRIEKFEYHLYDFMVEHIKGNQNLIPDFLSDLLNKCHK
ncbi:uncharacterized protein LOC126661756 [Mercurialis annua]|uniref:uncharacterized protein LOC126661756 n=1 Tax=Mercurialis annua TaxID=3986 RepID=UPI00215FFBF8|nr:uncharacterized protein LOC126661756 [Mercurialis annua]